MLRRLDMKKICSLENRQDKEESMKKGNRIVMTKGVRLGTTSKFAKKGDKGTYIGQGGHKCSLIKLDKAEEAYVVPDYYFLKLLE